MAFLLHKIIRYRLRVTRENLKNAFPDKSEEELYAIEKNFYRNLSDIAIETIKGFTISNKSVLKRHKVINPELLDKYYLRGQSLIGVLGHYGNWEWGTISAGLQLKHKPVAIYKPLHNPFIDRFIKQNRAKRGTILAPVDNTAETFENYSQSTCLFLLAADQSPVNLDKSYWVDFLNQDTACLHGPEKYARIYNYPVIFIEIERVKRGYYHIHLSELIAEPRLLPEGETTKRYMQKLEVLIRNNPGNWLWTHRRWKRKRIKST